MAHSFITLLEKLHPDEARSLIETLGETAIRTMQVSLIEALPEEEVPALQALLEKGSGEEIETYLQTHLPQYEDILSASLQGLQKDLDDFMHLSGS